MASSWPHPIGSYHLVMAAFLPEPTTNVLKEFLTMSLRSYVHPSLKMSLSRRVLVCMVLTAGIFQAAQSQTISNNDRESGRDMLRMIRLDIQKYYYDPSFHGIDLEGRFKEADEKIKSATSNGQIFGIIAQALLDFNDSHLFFLTPPRVSKVEYGWQMQAVGDKCYVVAV